MADFGSGQLPLRDWPSSRIASVEKQEFAQGVGKKKGVYAERRKGEKKDGSIQQGYAAIRNPAMFFMFHNVFARARGTVVDCEEPSDEQREQDDGSVFLSR